MNHDQDAAAHYPHGRGYGHDYMRGGEVLGGYGYAEREEYAKRRSIYQKTVPLAPGTYRLNVVAKDKVGGNLNNYELAITVPRLDSEKVSASTLILADLVEKELKKSEPKPE